MSDKKKTTVSKTKAKAGKSDPPATKGPGPEFIEEPTAPERPIPTFSDSEPEAAEPPSQTPVEEPGPEPLPKRLVSGPAGEFGVPAEHAVSEKHEPRIRLKNCRNKAVDITLEHDVYCAAIGRCVCSSRDVIRERRLERGSAEQVAEVKRVKMPRSVIIPPMGVSEPLHEAVKRCADVAPKLANRPQRLRVLPV